VTGRGKPFDINPEMPKEQRELSRGCLQVSAMHEFPAKKFKVSLKETTQMLSCFLTCFDFPHDKTLDCYCVCVCACVCAGGIDCAPCTLHLGSNSGYVDT